MGNKSKFKSKTVWVNSLTVLASVLVALQNHDLIASNAQATAWIIAAIGATNVVLRFLTTEPIS